MAAKKHLGIFWGSRSVSVVEIENQLPRQFFTAYPASPEGPEDLSQKKAPERMGLMSVLSNSLQEHKIATIDASLSLPSKDIIFRSFVIPWMNPQEIKGVVEFESRKYIPFKLSELAYAYHEIPFNDKTTRLIRILFAAIKYDVLEDYCSLIEQSGLHVVFIEPAPVSLIRALTFKKALTKDKKKIALIQIHEREGQIVVVDGGIPEFVRDFQLVPELQKEEMDKETFTARLFNEIRISLDYYGRQYTPAKVDGIIVLSSSESDPFSQSLEKELGLPVQSVKTTAILNTPLSTSTDLLYAYGIGLTDAVSLPGNFIFSRKMGQQAKAAAKEEKVPLNYGSLVKVIILCTALVAGAFFLFDRQVREYKNKLAGLSQKQASFQGLSRDEIKEKSQEISEKLVAYKNVRTESQVAFFLKMIPQLLPEGIWLKDLSIQYLAPAESEDKAASETQQKRLFKVLVALSGYAFDRNSSQQIRMVKTLVSRLKENKDFAGFFDDIDLVTAQTQALDENTVTFFRIDCK